ncbi:MAG: helix-turn-helix domain-containing protein [Myxococcaceae bacterium]|nr:MAG: helix-turn-helix domain-containing protein [Myxococcaceae bacterium]
MRPSGRAGRRRRGRWGEPLPVRVQQRSQALRQLDQVWSCQAAADAVNFQRNVVYQLVRRREAGGLKRALRPLSEDSRAALLVGNRFPTWLPDVAQQVWSRLPNGADEKKPPALRRNASDRMLSAMLGFRVVKVEDIDDRE